MYLKRIQIQGFKSFPNKTTIEFLDGITGIVGPNGSGKSNISDAIRWALGEQSTKMLRGSKMEDVIFAGSESRKPLGFAEVVLVFDNSDGAIALEYSEVAIKRRVFRSGESEYSINNNTCRLKDIRDIFMDTGIGKDGYSIVGQGKIDEILSNKPEERRHIFEEAAGIIKYKTRKEEAERKLKKTDENILRVNDILSELISRHDKLLAESKKAKRYKKIDSDLKSMEMDLILRKVRDLEEKIAGLEDDRKKRLEEKEGIEEKIKGLDLKIIEKEEKLSEIELRLGQLDTEYNEQNRELLDLNNKRTIIDESMRYRSIEQDRLAREIEENRSAIELNKKENETKLRENSELKTKLEDLVGRHSLDEEELSLRNRNLEKEEKYIEELKEEMLAYYNKITDKKGELSNLSNFKANILNQSTDIERELEKLGEERNEIVNKKKELVRNLEDENTREDNLKKEEDNLSSSLEKINKDRDELKGRLEKNNIDININKSQYNMNMNMQENYEGYYKSVRALMVNAKKNPRIRDNIVGVIADIISVDEKYTKAIDIALGSNIQNIVTPDEASAKELIDYLKSNKLGRATFLPMNIIKGRVFDLGDIDFDEYGILGLGSDVIEYDLKYKEIMESLLGRVIVTKNMDHSIRLAKKLRHSVRIVTLEGDIINPGGSMTGGSIYSKSSNILARKNNLRELEDERAKLLDSHKMYVKDLEKLDRNYLENKNRLLDISESLRDVSTNIHRMNNELEAVESNYRRINDRARKLNKDFTYFSRENESMLAREDRLREEISRMEEENSILKDRINRGIEEFKLRKLDRDKLLDEVTNQKISINSLEGEYRYNSESLKELLNKNTLLEDEIRLKLETVRKNKDSLITLEKDKKDISNLINKLVKEISLLEEEKTRLQEDRRKLSQNLKLLKEENQELFKSLEVVKAALNKIDLSKTKNSVYLEGYIEEIVETFNIDYTSELRGDHPDLDFRELETLISSSRKEIEKLGIVNLASIDEYEGVRERLDFMNSQVSDLNKAKGDLFKIIRELEEKMEVKFMSSFKTIRKNFNEVFKILFDGGKADLILEDKEDILNCGIEVKAQPPGKKFQSLSLLSGGERSLTAVALLFSILEMKPAPFCILDEIDAALDESNIDRYTNYLKKFSSDTQFIMITHRKRTMEIADSIYGVTMEEKGVSKTISMELSELEGNKEG